MPDVNELKYYIGLFEASVPFQIAVPILLAVVFAALADALQHSATGEDALTTENIPTREDLLTREGLDAPRHSADMQDTRHY